jgi:hypothetical protein
MNHIISIYGNLCNNTMKQFIYILLFFSSTCSAQFIDNKLIILFSYKNNLMLGNSFINDKGFVFPSLYANMNNSNSFSIKGLYKYKRNISIGAGLDINSYYNWNLNGYDDYLNSHVNSIEFYPVFQINSSYKTAGLLNRLKLFVQIGPNFGYSFLTLQKSLFDIQSDSLKISGPLNSRDFLWGFEFSGGFEFILSNNIGFFSEFGSKNYWVNSKLFNDTKFAYSFIEVGLYIRLKHDHHLYYY